LNFGLDGSKNLVIDVSICSGHIGNSTVNSKPLNSKIMMMMQTNDASEIT